ncbi:MAG: selenocysteine-specific translation elongation factor [Spirochaetota bacterium]
MYVIGTAGHVDHGKTSLIKALTGIDADRLPEEKQRQMTIDIGFAYIKLPTIGTVSIVDVPGHERFIRNMVTGAWGIDIGMLVIAADDGWMKQTDDHVKVLSILGIPSIVVALTKADKVTPADITRLLSDLQNKLITTPYRNAKIIPCSSITGEGIDTVKAALEDAIHRLPRPEAGNKPYLHIDRVFTVKGVGTVVTGTSKNGSFSVNDPITILPHAITTRIRQIQSHNTQQDKSDISQRTALALAGVEKEALKRGDIIVKENFFTATKHCTACITHTFTQLKNNQWIEVLLGTGSYEAQYSVIDEANNFIRLKFKEVVYCYPTEHFVATFPGGYSIIAGGYIASHKYSGTMKKEPLLQHIHSSNDPLTNALLATIVANPFITITQCSRMFPCEDIVVQKLTVLSEQSKIRIIGNHIVPHSVYDASVALCKQAAAENAAEADIAQKFSIPIEVVNHIVQEYNILQKEKKEIGDSEKQFLLMVLKKGIEGINPKDFPRHKIMIDALIKGNYLVVIDKEIVWHRDVFSQYSGKLMAHFQNNKELTIQQAKEITGLSRKYMIPLLNTMEQKNLIKRYGDVRIKV